MKVEDGVLIIDEEVSDEMVDEFLAVVNQEDIEKIEVNTNNIGASIVQILLIQKRDKEIILTDPIFQKIFENVEYKSI